MQRHQLCSPHLRMSAIDEEIPPRGGLLTSFSNSVLMRPHRFVERQISRDSGTRVFARSGVSVSLPLFVMANSKKGNSKGPQKTFRLKGITASVFRNSGSDGKPPYYKASLQRTYLQDGEFKTTSSFTRDHLPVAALLLNKAYEYILETEAAEKKESESDRGE